ncbi:MAG: CDP-diacylglycerol--glycerol-3-phosphate 3-phosphatidyltransferase [Deltaproteobacteria bacterium]|nr:CDP-diacylglycerol--glycerol-3-phosphate 3-phosphatidyltransferase [Deltaproteobacteria bacterium]
MEEHGIRFNTLPNRLSALRIACVPLVVIFLLEDSPRSGFIAALIFGIAGITDYFDGYYARLQKASTVVGKLLDPLADKFLVVSSLIMLMHLGRIHSVIVILLVCRELAITGLRAIAAAEGIVIGASRVAKWKTATQMAAIPMLMLHETYFYVPMQALGTVLIWISLLISLWSARDYIVDFFQSVKALAAERRREKLARKEKSGAG